MTKTKSFQISKRSVWEAWKRVKAGGGSGGVDSKTIESTEEKLGKNLYKLWNRMSSGTYFPSPVLLCEIPKGEGKTRTLGIPTVMDRVAQTVVKNLLEPRLEAAFHPDSYGYRPHKSATEAVGVTRKRCWEMDWVIDLDIQGFFDSIPHAKLIKLVQKYIPEKPEKWMLLYIERWLKVSGQRASGEQIERTEGTPQGGVISPLLANLYLHEAFDVWMTENFPTLPFERYADDGIIHCKTEAQAEYVLRSLQKRFEEWGLTLHSEKTKIVYCKMI